MIDMVFRRIEPKRGKARAWDGNTGCLYEGSGFFEVAVLS
jgi:hypothetical protein